MTHEHATPIMKVPDYLLDEWATTFKFYCTQEVEEIGLGAYCILEKGTPIPNIIKIEEEFDGLWNMFFDGSRNKNGSGASVMLVSPSLEKFYFSYRL